MARCTCTSVVSSNLAAPTRRSACERTHVIATFADSLVIGPTVPVTRSRPADGKARRLGSMPAAAPRRCARAGSDVSQVWQTPCAALLAAGDHVSGRARRRVHPVRTVFGRLGGLAAGVSPDSLDLRPRLFVLAEGLRKHQPHAAGSSRALDAPSPLSSGNGPSSALNTYRCIHLHSTGLSGDILADRGGEPRRSGRPERGPSRFGLHPTACVMGIRAAAGAPTAPELRPGP